MAAVTSYTVNCERVGRWWEVTVPEIDDVTQVKRLDQVEDAVSSLVHLMTGAYPDAVKLEVHSPAGVDDEVSRARRLREEAEQASAASVELSRDAARRLAAEGLPARDIGRILGVSYQRAAQFASKRAS